MKAFPKYYTFDVFKHVRAYLKAIRGCYRALKSRGCLLWSVPMGRRRHENTIRATIDDGSINHLREPKYHGNPVKQKRDFVFLPLWLAGATRCLRPGFLRCVRYVILVQGVLISR